MPIGNFALGSSLSSLSSSLALASYIVKLLAMHVSQSLKGDNVVTMLILGIDYSRKSLI